jgi:hypothetical protein
MVVWFLHYNYMIRSIATTGKGLEALSILVFLLLLILIAKGYTVTRARLKHKTSVKIGIFMGIYSLIYAILFVWEKSVSFQDVRLSNIWFLFLRRQMSQYISLSFFFETTCQLVRSSILGKFYMYMSLLQDMDSSYYAWVAGSGKTTMYFIRHYWDDWFLQTSYTDKMRSQVRVFTGLYSDELSNEVRVLHSDISFLHHMVSDTEEDED